MTSERVQRRIERLLDEIDNAEASGDWQQGLDRVRDALRIDKTNEETLAYRESSERRLGLSPEQVAESIAGNPVAWQWANGLILIAMVLSALALVQISYRFQGRGRPWTMTALVAFSIGAVLRSIDLIISIEVTTWGARESQGWQIREHD